MMENFSLVEKNSDNAMETVGIIFIKKNKLTHRALQTLETPQPYLPPLYKEPRIQLQPERSPCPLDPSVLLGTPEDPRELWIISILFMYIDHVEN